MNSSTYKKLAINLLLVMLICLAALISQPAAAQVAPIGTSKTINTVPRDTEEPVGEFPWQISLQTAALDSDTDSAAKMPGMPKVGNITLKRG